ncbi:MAG: xanthine dehydrogenase accessory factor [Rhodothermales bacterium]|jgi:xanthine dehydrogenase accessory factor
MRDVYPTMKTWSKAGIRFALARVIETWGSAPRPPGAAMIVSEMGQVAGSVSGGCIEGAVITEALGCIEDGKRRYCTFGVDSETAWSVGLSCGGQVSVLVQPFDPATQVGMQWLARLESGDPLQVRTALEGEDEGIADPQGDATTSLVAGIFNHLIPRQARLLIIGGADIAVHLTALAVRLDFEVTVIDPRAVFTDPDRFDVRPHRLVTAWPQEELGDFAPDNQTFAVLLTHDPRIDDPALQILLSSRAAYIGALGGRKTQTARRDRMRAAGFSEEDLGRICGPVGLRIGAVGPAEIAASIAAELVAVRRGVPVREPQSVQSRNG